MWAAGTLTWTAQGRLAANLASVGSGIRIFSESLGTEWRNTVVVVLSEFGRTFRENGSRGTDHGHGTVYWVLGGVQHAVPRQGFSGPQRLSSRSRRALPLNVGAQSTPERACFPTSEA